MQKRWILFPPNQSAVDNLSKALGITKITASVLANRGIVEPQEGERFLKGNLSSLHPPALLKDAEKAAMRIKRAIASNERIAIWGDYDVDGICGTALLYDALKKWGHIPISGCVPIFYLPNRMEEGYGLNRQGIDALLKQNITVLITVDCGISDVDEIAYLESQGVDVIVVDHHHPGEKLPPAYAILNPRQMGCDYPYKDLAGVGVAFKLAQFLLQDAAAEYLDLVALGTVADVAPLTGENRILVKAGLAEINRTKRIGLAALIEVARLRVKEIDAGHIGFILGPRINAAGRVGSPEAAFRLLVTGSLDEARECAGILDRGNRERQNIEEATLRQAVQAVEGTFNFKHRRVIVLHNESWHPGVLGIVASRLVERFYRPAIMISTQGGIGRGSGRSIPNFHLYEALSKCEGTLEEYGGHKHAAGLKVKGANLKEFEEAINKVAFEALQPEDLLPTVNIDAEVSFGDLTDALLCELEHLSPFGVGNPKPVFCSSGVKQRSRPNVVGRGHLKMYLTDGRLTCEAIGFKMAGSISTHSSEGLFDVAFTPTFNTWQGERAIQLELKDIRPFNTRIHTD